MQKVRSFLKEIPLISVLFLLILFFFPFEYKYDRPLRPFLYPFLPKYVAKSFYVYLTDLSIFLVGLGYLWKKRNEIKEFISHPGTLLFLGVTFFTFHSLYLAKNFITPYHWLKAFYFFLTFLLYGLIAYVFKNRSARPFLHFLFWGVLIFSTFEATVGILQYFRQKQVGVHILGEPKWKSQSFSRVEIWIKDSKVWIFDSIYRPKAGNGSSVLRAYGTFPHPNVLGGYLLFSTFCTYALYLVSKFRRKTLFFGLILFWQVFAMILTFSRAALFGWILGSGFWLIAFLLSKKPKAVKIRFWKLVSITGLCLFVGISLVYPQLKERGGTVGAETTLSQQSDEVRISAQHLAWKVIKTYPITGVGYANYESAVRQLFPTKFAMIHNIYLMLAGEMGLIAFLFFMALICYSLKKGWEQRENPFIMALLAAFVGTLFIGCCDYYPLFFQQSRLLFFSIAALLTVKPFSVSLFENFHKEVKSS
ncbi:MAG TPA: O-antigen ligase family protein [Chlamydiales bacterium]|nr:O-antigen ligase family protein [Chlamydiales bacterium]